MNPEINIGEEIKTSFKEGYDMLPAKFQIPVRDNIMKECGWKSIITFHQKRKGTVQINILEIPVIEKHFAKHNIDAWTGEYLS